MRIGEILSPQERSDLLWMMYDNLDAEHRDLDLEDHQLRNALLRAQVEKHWADAAEARAAAARLVTGN
jgi:hypothetical protein